MNKSEVAYRMTCEILFRQEPKIYFWTFTLRRLYPDWFVSRAWARFVSDLGNLYGGRLKGVRVTELHEQRGIHYHGLLNQRIWVEVVRRLAARYGFGRVHVMRANYGAVNYLAQYILPCGRSGLWRGLRRWGTVGGFDGVQVRDLKVESPYHAAVLQIQQLTGVSKLQWAAASHIMQQVKAGKTVQDIVRPYEQKTGKAYVLRGNFGSARHL